MGKGLPGGRSGRQAGLTIGSNRTALSPQIDHGARPPRAAGGHPLTPAVPSSRPIVVDTRLHPEGEPSSSSDAIRRVVLQGRCRGRPTWLPRQVRLRGAAWAMWTGAP
jgi:hypothetical protein